MISDVYGVCVLIVKNGTDQILGVTRKNDHSDWGLPGGKVEQGEDPKIAAARELKEETGLTIDPGLLLPLYSAYAQNPAHPGVWRRVVTYSASFESCTGELYNVNTLPENEGLVDWIEWTDILNGSFGDYNVGVQVAFNCVVECIDSTADLLQGQ